MVPGWLSATVVAAVTGVLLLAVFKYTSNQRAIKRVRNDINANLLALKLFKDSAAGGAAGAGARPAGRRPAVRARRRADAGDGRAGDPASGPARLWYQARPLRVGEDAVITLKLDGDAGSSWPAVSLEPTDAVEVEAGPVRVRSKREVCWNVKAREPGSHRLVFQVGDQTDRQGTRDRRRLHAGQHSSGPAGTGRSILLNPWEEPFRPDDPVRSIAIDYPRAVVVDQRHRLLGDLLVRRLDGRRLVLPPCARTSTSELQWRIARNGELAAWTTRSSSYPGCRAPARRS